MSQKSAFKDENCTVAKHVRTQEETLNYILTFQTKYFVNSLVLVIVECFDFFNRLKKSYFFLNVTVNIVKQQ